MTGKRTPRPNRGPGNTNPKTWDIEISDAEAIARENFGLDCRVERLPGEVDRNFLLNTDTGDRWVLKISRPKADRQVLECQLEALRFLESSAVE